MTWMLQGMMTLGARAYPHAAEAGWQRGDELRQPGAWDTGTQQRGVPDAFTL